MEIIQSPQNKQIKEWKKLSSKKGRLNQRLYMLDGWHLVKEAIRANENIQRFLIVPDSRYVDEFNELNSTKAEITYISSEVAHALSETISPQGIFAIMMTNESRSMLPSNLSGAWLLLDGVQDPGNIGTMIRTADAAGFRGVVFGNGTGDLYQPKVVRSMQGSQFHLELLQVDLTLFIAELKKKKIPTFGTELNKDAKSYDEIGKYTDFGLIMGNEGNGVQPEHLKMTRHNLYIPIIGKAESLNVAVAAGILMYTLKK
ncbi:MAG: RNA methyltransferase [Liquorilactobacillus hordei]|uniref:23S rRNA methyltransferase n=1 Tax=Liquorilactobacillus hordei DSM 19519 TaxID=1423759 RepID=A0A0R1MFH4_9LACO|nr:RNA methyltransferase [Liquorilactobacillus hordei]KRL06710.1 23S rRNA methyltransferase [Liquorilactobacillus hordei DSM 19519]MBZ2405163.1 RNA methyltransferase [Liquorilactobacillus hordei]QYH52293.1 RNA methyltransferase [Liquorilactobacillus hordei DSM 19519]